ncbi:MAG TPA: hypothetical protein PLH57_05145 [Oligoflexia bacterium]|nr:hypothetical protein [Oligoflexia bacterium]
MKNLFAIIALVVAAFGATYAITASVDANSAVVHADDEGGPR